MKSVLLEKSKNLSSEIVRECLHIQKEKKEFDITRQLIRSVTSVSACISEANAPESRKDFVHKLSIARKELVESKHWIEILFEVDLFEKRKVDLHLTKLAEVYKMLNASLRTSKRRLGRYNR